MDSNNQELRELQRQTARRKQLEVMLRDLLGQKRELSQKAAELETVKRDEQADVDRLEGRSLAGFFYNVIGKMDEKLTEERQEAYAARVKYDAAVRELSAVEEDLERTEAELRELEGCEARYEEALGRKAAELKAAGGRAGETVLEFENRLAFIGSRKKELREAISAGQVALGTTDEILSRLDSAEGWAAWDLLGGGLIVDLAKHSRLDEAQAAVEQLQIQLRRFRTELADVTVSADVQVRIDGFLRFADYFFDGLFADWAVMDQIRQSQEQVQRTRDQIADVLARLDGMLCAADQEERETREQLDGVICGTV